MAQGVALSENSAHLDTDSASNIYEVYVRELLLNISNLGVVNCSPNNALEGADSVAEVGALESFCRLSNGSLFYAERDERSRREMEFSTRSKDG